MGGALDVMVAEVRGALVGGAQAGEAGASEPQTLGANRPADRFELFHAANSICSQKVRTILAQHDIAHVSRSVNIFAGETYLPSYVRLRMFGCARLATPLAAKHSGSTSFTAGGCDAAVVPTLVDWQTDDVIVDSKRICLYLDDLFGEAAKLRPQHLAAAIDAELAIVDNLPNYQMLTGSPPKASSPSQAGHGAKPDTPGGSPGPAFSMKKVARCERYLAEFADDPVLVQAYTAKRDKELNAAEQLFSPEAMQAAYTAADAACRAFDGRLGASGSAWLFGAALTMADLFWGVELLRMENMGAAMFWEAGRLPHVERFAGAIKQLPSIKKAILDWPGALF